MRASNGEIITPVADLIRAGALPFFSRPDTDDGTAGGVSRSLQKPFELTAVAAAIDDKKQLTAPILVLIALHVEALTAKVEEAFEGCLIGLIRGPNKKSAPAIFNQL
jgi:hypothetical protein